MTIANNKPVPSVSENKDRNRLRDLPEMIDRLAREMRARSGGELPHSFCVEQVKRQLSGQSPGPIAANDTKPPAQAEDGRTAAIFRCWALSE
jgi:hypothetical protein